MKKNKYFIGFVILQILMALLFLYDFTLGLLFTGVVMLYELFYVMVLYKSNDRKYLKTLTFLLVFIFFAYEYFLADAANLVVLLFMFINSLFIFSYFKENELPKRGVIDLFRYLYPIMCILFYLFGYYREFAYFLVIMYPLLFINLNKSKLDIALIYICTLVLLIFRENLFTYGVMSYLTMLTLYYSFNKSKKNIEIVLPLLVITILVSVSLEGSILGKINSRVFENELMIIKFIKAFIGLFPVMYYASFYALKAREKKYKTNYDIFVLILCMVGYFVLILYTRLDIPCIIVTVSSLLFVALYKLQCNVGKRVSNKVLVLTEELDNDKVNMINEISSDKKVICLYKKDVKNSLDVKYIVGKKPKDSKSFFGNLISFINKYRGKSAATEFLYDDNSKYLIAYTNSFGELISEHSGDNTVKIIILDDKDDDEEHVLSVSRAFEGADYLLFETKKLLDLYKDNVKAKCMLYDKSDKKLLNNLTK